MPGVFDRLQKEIKDKQKDGGITPLDMVDLPPALRKIMRVMLRKVQMSYPELTETMEAMPEKERLSSDELEEAIATLVEQSWLMKLGCRRTPTWGRTSATFSMSSPGPRALRKSSIGACGWLRPPWPAASGRLWIRSLMSRLKANLPP